MIFDVMVISRFRWEDPEVKPAEGAEEQPEGEGGDQGDARFEDAGPRLLYERVNAGLCFEHVRRVRTQNLNLKDKDQVLSLLTVECQPRSLTLVFSGGALVRLEVASIACFLEDLGEPWPTPWLPLHESGSGESGDAGTGGPEAGT